MLKRIAVLAALSALCVISGAVSSSSANPGPQVLDVYSSMPLHGVFKVPAVALVNGNKLALKQAGGSAGPWTID